MSDVFDHTVLPSLVARHVVMSLVHATPPALPSMMIIGMCGFKGLLKKA